MNEQDLKEARMARWAEDALRQLPTRRAPVTLGPRVRAAVARLEGAPWFLRPWLEWPMVWRAFSIALTGGAGLALNLWVIPHTPMPPLPTEIVPGLQPAVSLWSSLFTLANGLAQALIHSSSWIVALALGGLAALWCLTLGLGTACWRLSVSNREF